MPSFCPAWVQGHYPNIGTKMTKVHLGFNYIAKNLLTIQAATCRVEVNKTPCDAFF